MLLTVRPATVADFMKAYDRIAPMYGPKPPDLERAWAALLALESVWSLVVEDIDGPRRPLNLSLSAFVSDRCADRIEGGHVPWFPGALASRFLSEGDEPLRLDVLREGHRGRGLNLVVLHTVGLDVGPGEASTGIVGDRRASASREWLRGWRLQRCLREVHSPQAYASFVAGGWKVRSDYSDALGSFPGQASLERPVLLGLNRAEAAAPEAGGLRMSALFHDYPIRLELRRLHRELLWAAMEGLTDAELAERLSLSSSAVKKRWAAIYAHVSGKIPGLPEGQERLDGARGVERRRHVLNYLREHPEEFRPIVD